jgi:DNA adenine methylase
MQPIFKYSGGKKRECKFLKSILPQINRIVEPFAGSCALAFYLEKPALVSDVRSDVITTLRVVQDQKLYPLLQERIDELSSVNDKLKLKDEFYLQRDNNFGCINPLDIAYRFIVIRQLVFSGMDRVNAKTGKENAPFAWYGSFKCNLSKVHHELLQSWEIRQQSYEETFKQLKQDDLVFLDPPYASRNSTYALGDPGNQLHVKLQKLCNECEQKFLLVHCEHELYNEFCLKHDTITKDFMYAQNFKGRNNTKSKTKHLYIRNYNLDNI